MAGLDTSSSTLEWTISELLRHPHAMKTLQQEIESTVGKDGKVTGSDVGRMKYLQCVVKEALRLYPPVPLALPHESVEAATVGGYDIPKKTTVMLNLWAIGRDPNVWGEDALDFKPERFMNELGGHANIMDLVSIQSDFRMIPFSAGRRGCPGAAMAIPMIELALAQLLHFFDWRLEGTPSAQIPLVVLPTLRTEIF